MKCTARQFSATLSLLAVAEGFSRASLATEATAPTPRQVQTTPLSCAARSLSTPRIWLIFDPSYRQTVNTTDERRGDMGFGGMNIGTQTPFECYQQDINLLPKEGSGDDTWLDCDTEGLQFKFDLGNHQIDIQETWTCADKWGDIEFVAQATARYQEALGCTYIITDEGERQPQCLYPNSNLFGRFIKPVSLMPTLPAHPYENLFHFDSCTELSQYPVWEISDLVYERGMGADEGLSFNLTNMSNGGHVECHVLADEGLTMDQLHRTRPMACRADGETERLNFVSETAVMFDIMYGTLGVRQNWECDSEYHWGLAYIAVNFTCEGNIADPKAPVRCTLPTTSLAGYPSQSVPSAFPHTAYERSCTLNSLDAKELVLRKYHMDEDAGHLNTRHRRSNVRTGAFTIYNPGPGDEYEILGLSLVGDTQWRKCDVGERGRMPWQLVDCQAAYDAGSGNIAFRFAWLCDDRDPSNAITFGIEVQGVLGDESEEVVLEVSNFRWEDAGGPMDRGPSLPWV